MMKVCHLSDAHGQEDTRIFHKECTSLAKAGYDVYEITRGETYKKNGVQIVGVKSAGKSLIQRVLETTRKVYQRAIEIDADVYHAHDPELIPALLKLKKRGKIVIFDSHENNVGLIEEKEYIPKHLRKSIQKIFAIYQRSACLKFDAVITATPNMTEYFKSLGCTRVIDLCNFPILKESFNEPSYNSGVISFAGGITRQWNHEHIISSINGIEGVKYILCGSGNAAYIENLKLMRGWEKVDFKGRQPFEKVGSFLQSSCAGMSLLTPGANTDWENGNWANTKIFEEMMAGLPVICTGFKRWRTFIEEYDCGICVDPHDEKAIAEAIKKLINNPEEARKKGLNGRHAVEERFNWENEEKKLIHLYKEIEEELYNG